MSRSLGAVVVVAIAGLVGMLIYHSELGAHGQPDATRFPIRGVDVSHHQGAIDWSRVSTAGVDFAYIKATEGRDFKDTHFQRNWRSAAEAGLATGAYHFFTFCSSGLAQAHHFLRVVPPRAGALVPVADVEFVGNCTSWASLEDVRRELSVFLQEVEQAWGVAPVLYVTPDSHQRVLAGAFGSYATWLRAISQEPSQDAYGGWLIWQYSDSSSIPGIRGPVDLNTLRPGASLHALVVAPAVQQGAAPDGPAPTPSGT